MTPQDFSTYCQASYSLWYSDGLSQFDVDRLPLNSRFHALYAPAYNAPRWHVVLFEIKTMRKIVGVGMYRAYVAIETVNLEYAPFDWQPIVVPYELPKEELQADTSDAWLDYIDTGNVSPEIEAVLPTLGSYEATKAIEKLESIEEMERVACMGDTSSFKITN